MAEHTHYFNLRISPIMYAQLKKLSEKAGVSMAEIVRDLIVQDYSKLKKEQHDDRNS
jgi:predicted DNA-binding protein